MPLTTIFIADDQPISRRGLLLIISSALSAVVVGEISSFDELLGHLRQGAAELLIISGSFARDLAMLRKVKANFPAVSVLVFNGQPNDLAAMQALRAGASGYIDATSSPDEFLDAIQRLQGGGTYLPHVIAQNIAADLARGREGAKLHERLSPRELEVFRLLGAGKSVGEIARKLKISVKTVSTHRTRILEKTGMRNNADIIRYSILNNLLS